MELPADNDDLLPAGELDARTAALQQQVAAVARRCTICKAALCGHAALLAVVLGCRNAPRCPRCAAAETDEAVGALVERALQWIVRRECFVHVWRGAGIAEGHGPVDRPPCMFAAGVAAPAIRPHPATTAVPPAASATWDAGDLGCGDLVLELRARLRALPAGAVLHLIAHDPAAPVDLPAWCGLVGHTLVSSDHPHYHLQRKRD